ncbi:MAG: ATP-dependent Clp protease ATP-binding subunit [Patescibacteria group bacterium]
MPKQKPQETLLTCKECNGTGFLGISKCLTCRGMGAGIFSGKYFLYWGGARTAKEVPYKKIKRVLNKLMDSALILLGIAGFLNLGYQGYLSGFGAMFSASFWGEPNQHLLLFFVALLGILYFAARSTRIAHFFENPLRLGFGEKMELFSALTWKDVRDYKTIDVSKSFSLHSEESLEGALLAAKKLKIQASPELLFLSLLKTPKVKILFGRLGINVKNAAERVKRNLASGEDKNILISGALINVLLGSYIFAAQGKNKKVRSNILLLETVKQSDFLKEVLYDLNVDLEKLQNVVRWIEIQDKLRERYMEFRKASLLRPKGDVNRAMTAVQTPVLNRFSEDLTYYAKRGLIDFCIGREEIIENVFRVIKGGGRGVVLVGERGVGKSAIIDGVAELMVKEEVPDVLNDKRLVRLALSEILGGSTAKEAGEKLMAAINDALRAGNIVVDIPNLEYFGTGEGLSLAALLAEELAKSRLPVMASTTPEGYKQVVEGTPLANIFEKVDVPEPDTNLAIQILEAESGGIEYKTQVYFSYDALAGAVKLSDKYLHDRFLPEKAREIIREAATYVLNKRGKNSVITYEDIANIVSEKGKVPLTAVTETEKEKLLKLEDAIRTRVIGQEEAVDAVSRALRRARAGMHQGKKPIANFLFLGPTGVGKTELSKTIAEVYFGNESNMIRVDMSEYQEKSSAERMIGGNNETGFLTEAVRQKPFALLLLDEIEKAHPDILNLFLQVMDDGRLTDGKGRTVDFTNLIIIATSNAGSDFIARAVEQGMAVPEIAEKLTSEKLGQYFRPEFINRFDGVIVFKPLAQEEIVKIADLLVKKIAKNMENKGIELVLEKGALGEVAKLGFDPKFGARPLRRVISREIEDRLANLLLQGKVKRRDRVVFNTLEDVQVVPAKKL